MKLAGSLVAGVVTAIENYSIVMPVDDKLAHSPMPQPAANLLELDPNVEHSMDLQKSTMTFLAAEAVDWHRVPGGLKMVSVDDVDNVWGVTSNDDIYFRQGLTGTWQHIDGKLSQIDVDGNGAYVWGVTSNDYIYFRQGNTGNWQQTDGRLNNIAVAPNGHVWGVNSGGLIYFRDGFHGHWQGVDGALKSISVGGSDGQYVWGVTSNDDIYFRQGLTGTWQHVGGKLSQIDVGNDGVVWGVNSGGLIYFRNGFHGHWQGVNGRLNHVSAGMQIWGVTDANEVYMSVPAPATTTTLKEIHVGWATGPTRVIIQECTGGEWTSNFTDSGCGQCSAMGHCGWKRGFTFFAYDTEQPGTTQYYVSHAGNPKRSFISPCPRGVLGSSVQDPKCGQCGAAGHCGWTSSFSFWAFPTQKTNTVPFHFASTYGPARSLLDSCPGGTDSVGMVDTPCRCSAAGNCGWSHSDKFYAFASVPTTTTTTTTLGSCRCVGGPDYGGVCSAKDADFGWCYVEDHRACPDAVQGDRNRGNDGWWSKSACTCGCFGGSDYGGVCSTRDADYSWCYVKEHSACADAIHGDRKRANDGWWSKLACEHPAVLECPEGSEQVGGDNADVGGCGLETCDDRYSIPDIQACLQKCVGTEHCRSFTWAPAGGDKNHLNNKVCTIYDTDVSNQGWGPNQIMCKPPHTTTTTTTTTTTAKTTTTTTTTTAKTTTTSAAPQYNCNLGDVSSTCPQLGDGGHWDNNDLSAWYVCLADNCMDQTTLWDGVSCADALQSMTCDGPVDFGRGEWVGTIGDACPRSCNPKCAKCITATTTIASSTTIATTTIATTTLAATTIPTTTTTITTTLVCTDDLVPMGANYAGGGTMTMHFTTGITVGSCQEKAVNGADHFDVSHTHDSITIHKTSGGDLWWNPVDIRCCLSRPDGARWMPMQVGPKYVQGGTTSIMRVDHTIKIHACSASATGHPNDRFSVTSTERSISVTKVSGGDLWWVPASVQCLVEIPEGTQCGRISVGDDRNCGDDDPVTTKSFSGRAVHGCAPASGNGGDHFTISWSEGWVRATKVSGGSCFWNPAPAWCCVSGSSAISLMEVSNISSVTGNTREVPLLSTNIGVPTVALLAISAVLAVAFYRGRKPHSHIEEPLLLA